MPKFLNRLCVAFVLITLSAQASSLSFAASPKTPSCAELMLRARRTSMFLTDFERALARIERHFALETNHAMRIYRLLWAIAELEQDGLAPLGQVMAQASVDSSSSAMKEAWSHLKATQLVDVHISAKRQNERDTNLTIKGRALLAAYLNDFAAK